MNSSAHTEFLRKVDRYLFVFLLLMIAGFFTWSENILITRGIKLVGRNGVLFGTYMLYRYVQNYGLCDISVKRNQLSYYLYIAYLVLGFASFTWSTNVGFSALQWFMTLQSLVFCVFFIKILTLIHAYFPDSKIRLFRLLGNSIFLLLVIFIVGMFVNPDVFFRMTHGGSEARLGGYLMNPNELGMLAGVGIASLIFNFYEKHKVVWNGIKIVIIVYALLATGSRSSLIGVLIILLFHVQQSNRNIIKGVLFLGIAILSPIAIYFVVLKGGDPERVEEVLTMTGRLPFWKALINEGLPREPFFGFGFMRIDYNEYFQSTNTYPGKMTHNTFLQVLMNLGFVGIVLVIFQMIFTFKGISSLNKEKKIMLLSISIPIFINSMTEFGIFGESNYGILFYQLIILGLFYSYRTKFTSNEKRKMKISGLRPKFLSLTAEK